jgi:hypothetical protein
LALFLSHLDSPSLLVFAKASAYPHHARLYLADR